MMNSRARTQRLQPPVAITAGLLWLFACAVGAISAVNAPDESAVRVASGVVALPERASAPLAFEPNRGQAAAAVRYLSRGRGYLVALGDDRAAVMLLGAQPTALHMFFANANTNVTPVHEQPLAARVNYLLGANQNDWQVGVPTYAAVRYPQLWSGVDLVFHSRKGRLEYDFVVAPGVTPAAVGFRFEGHRALRVDDDGQLRIDTAAGVLLQAQPEIYQFIDGVRRSIDGGYRVRGDDRLGFWIGEHDRTHAVVIDPVLDYSTYLGGRRTDGVSAIASDANGNTYVTGATRSWDFPADSFLGPAFSHQRQDIFVSKLTADGSEFLYTTYIGGLGNDSARAIAVDAQGHAYVVGSTRSRHSFPGPHGHRWFAGGDHDAFVAKLSPAGDALQFATVFGGNRRDVANAVAVAADGDVVLAGETRSTHGFMVEQALQPTRAGQLDAFVARLSGDGANVRFATYLGGSSRDVANAVAVDDLGDIYVAGSTASHDDFPLQKSMYSHRRDPSDAFISKLSADGQALLYSSFLGGKRADEAWAIAIDSERRAYVAGSTNSHRDFPVVNALQDQFGGATDGFIARLNAAGDALDWSTYLGGRRYDDIRAIVLDPALDPILDDAQRVWVAGSSNSRTDFPVVDAVQVDSGGRIDAIVVRINVQGSATSSATSNSIDFATFLGGRQDDWANAIALNPDGSVVVGGVTRSRNDFPVENALQPQFGGGSQDGFVARYTVNQAPVITSTPIPTAAVGELYQYQAEANDPEDDALAWSLGEPTQGMTIDAETGRVSFTPTQSATLTVTVQVEDGQGNADSQTFELVVHADNQAPQFISSPVVNAERASAYAYDVEAQDSDGDSLTYSLGAAPSGMVIDTLSGLIEWTPETVGAFAVVVFVDDGNANQVSQSFTVTVDDSVAPTISITAPADGSLTHQTAITITGLVDENATLLISGDVVALASDGSFSYPSTLSEGSNEFELQASDPSGNQGDAQFAVTLDTIAPVITLAAPVDGAITNALSITVNGTLDAGANANTIVTVNGTPVSLDPGLGFSTSVALLEGDNPITVQAVDNAGNASSAVVNVTRDTVVPAILITTPVGGALTNNDQLFVSGTVSVPSTIVVNGNLVASDALSFSFGPVTLAEGVNNFLVAATDVAGNEGTANVQVTLDSVAPQFTLLVPQNGAVTNVSAQPILGQLSEVATLTVNGQSVVVAADGQFNAGTLALNEGANSISLLASDAAGNSTQKGVLVTLDTIAPEIVLNEPQEGVTVSNTTVRFAGTLSEAVALLINSQNVTVAADISFSADLSLSEGLNSIAVVATDAAGNASTVERNVIVDATPPALPDVSFITRSSPALEIIAINGDAGAVEGGTLVVLTNPSNGFAVSVPANADGLFSAALRGFANDTVQISARDASGNASSSVNLTPANPNQLTLDSIGDRIAPLGQETRFTVTATGSGGDVPELSISPAPLPDGMRFDRGTGELVYRPTRAQVGEIELTIVAEAIGERVSEAFTVIVPEPASDAPTTFNGRVLDANAMAQGDLVPLVGATVSFLGTGVSAVTDADGYFALGNLPLSAEVLDLDADTAVPGPGGTVYASFREGFALEPGVDNIEHRAFYLPRLAAESLTSVDPSVTTVVNNSSLGVTLTVPPGTARNADGSLYSGDLSISLVPRDFAPANMPEMLDPALLITIQPVGVVYSEPVPITFANSEGFAPGTEVDLWSVDPDLGRFVIVGTMQVSADGLLIQTVSGGIRANDWHMQLALAATADQSASAKQAAHKPCPACGARAAASTFSMHDGHMETNFSLPAYRSLEANRTLTFGYRSFRAYVRPVVELNALLPVRAAVPGRMSFELSVGGVTQEHEIYLDSSTLAAGIGDRFRISALFDGDTFASGMYPYRLRLTNEFQSRVSTIHSGTVMVVNESASAFGSGWMLMGLDKLAFNAGTSVTMIAASGDSVNYLADEAQADAFISPDNSFSVFAREPDGSYTHTEKNGVRMRFNAQGQLTARIDRNSNTTTYAYDAEDRLFRLTDPVGLVTVLAYDTNGRLSTVIDPAGRVSRFTQDVRGNLVRIDYPDDTFERFEYDDRHLLTAHEDERHLRFADRYDAFGRAVEGVLPDGTVRAVSAKTAVGLVDVSSGVGSRQSPAPITRPDAVAGGYVDGRGNTQRAELDSHGRATLHRDELGRVTTHERDADSNATRTVRANGSVVTRTFDDRGNVLSTTEAFNGALTTFTYDANSLVTSVTNAREHVSTINRNALTGNVESVVNHLGHTRTLEYDTRGLVRRSVSANGLETVFDYDAQGLLERRSETPPAGAAGNVRITQYTYFPTGLMSQLITPDGITLDYAYDARSKLESVTDQLGQQIRYFYDAHENLVRTETANGDASLALLVEQVYDNRNRLVETHLAHAGGAESVTTRLLDENSNLVGLTDPNTNSSSNVYDAFNRLRTNTHRLQGETVYDYHLTLDRVARVTAPNGVVTEYGYDDLGRRTSETSSDRGTLSYAYDVANNVTAITDGRGITVTMGYDELERVSGKIYPNTIAAKVEDVQYSYDSCPLGVGRLCGRTDESGGTAFEYDAWGNVLTRTFTDARSAVVYSTQYAYDDGDHIERMHYPSGRVLDIVRDGVRRMAQIDATQNGVPVNVVSNISYRGDNQLLSCTFGNGVQETRSYDLQGRLLGQALSSSSGVIIDERNYSHDANGNIFGIDSNVEDNTYAYDALDRLTADGIDLNPSIGYGYDLNDNRLSRSSGAVASERVSSYQYQVDSNRIQSISQLQVGSAPLPPAGSVERELVYNAAGRLFQLIVDGLPRAEYLYNDNGQRTHKVVFDDTGAIESTTVFHYDSAGHLISETDAAGLSVRDYVWHESMSPLAQIDGAHGNERITYLHTDHLMTNRLGTDELQGVVWRWEGEAFGETPAQELSGVRVDLRFPGQYVDAESGLFYNWNRYYDPSIGRYITSDPIGLEGGINTYLYANSNPVRYYDPYGLFWLPGDPLSQSSVDLWAGFGDGLSSVLTLGMYSTEDLRGSLGIDGGVDECSTFYSGAKYAGYGWALGLGGVGLARGAAALGPTGKIIGHPAYGGRTISTLRGGRVRFGWSRDSGPTLRLGIKNRHIDLVKLKPPRQ
jgi:RHS repeat-associated protein